MIVMIKKIFQYLLIFSVFVLLALTGMQLAKNGISKVTSTNYYQLEDIVSVGKVDGKREATVLGRGFTGAELKKREQELEKLSSFNYVTSIGKGITSFVTGVVGHVIKLIEKVPSLF